MMFYYKREQSCHCGGDWGQSQFVCVYFKIRDTTACLLREMTRRQVSFDTGTRNSMLRSRIRGRAGEGSGMETKRSGSGGAGGCGRLARLEVGGGSCSPDNCGK